MKQLFESLNLAGIPIRNRFVRSATWEGMATDKGEVTDDLVSLMVALANGGVGLIVSSHAYVSCEGQASPWQVGIYEDGLIPGLEKMATAVHDAGGRIILQLAHGGYYASAKLSGAVPFAASDIAGNEKTKRRVMSEQDIADTVSAFAEGARRAKEAGFDGVQIHAAHGYLLSQFLSPAFNRRTDAYGGDITNRSRFLMEVFQRIRETVGNDYPVLIKMNGADYIDDGLVVGDSVQVAQQLSDVGIDAIELSGGVLTSPKLSPSRVKIDSEEKEAYFKAEAARFKSAVDVPLILVGGIRSLPVAERLLTEGTADYFSMSRPLIKEPGLINRWADGDTTRAECISDNRCFMPAMHGKGVCCNVQTKTG
ncbi:MAG: NADH:flavin oxidoreductase [Thermodesulfobacteriota bacterium]|nr:NADH:flavin oxidoreductase [Thermodesulfobacteriota bacterium]